VRWWQRLGDPELDALIEEGIAHNLDVAAAKARIREARASYRQTIGGLLPDAGSSAGMSRSGAGSRRYTTSYSAGLSAGWEVDLFGANKRALEAAGYGLDSAAEELRATQIALIGDIAATYVTLRGHQARLAFTRRTIASQAETAALTRRQLEAGSATSLDALRATTLVDSTEASLPGLEAAYAETVHRLSVLTGRVPEALIGRFQKARPIPQPATLPPTGIPAEVLNARPDVRIAERQYASSTARIGQAEAARYPRISLTGGISTAGLSISDLAKASSIGWSFGPSLSVPIFQGGQLAAAVDAAEAGRDQSFLNYHATVLEALEDVENAIIALSVERQTMRKLTTVAQTSREALRISRELYTSGASNFLNVLDAERSTFSAETSLIDSRVGIATSYIALMRALGGGWDGEVDTDTPVVVDSGTGPHFWRPDRGA
jgi:NodT family efflux transporter outer membrane factor (OMF) lipoprotein